MIESFEVSNFKLFEHLKLEGLGRVNLIVGANNTGKTALLEALYLDGRRDFAAAVIDIMRQRKQSGEPTIEPFLRSWFKKPHNFTFPVGGSRFTFHVKHGRQMLERQNLTGISSIELEQELKGLDRQRLAFDENFEDSLAIWHSGLDEQFRDRYWDQLLLRGEDQRMFQLLRILEPNIQRVGLIDDGHTDRQPYYTDETMKQYPLARLGQGINRLLGIAFGMSFTRGNRLVVDEIETGLHYEAMELLWRWIFDSAAALNVQVFATTHSFDCVKAFVRAADPSAEVKDSSLYRLDRVLGPLRVVRYKKRQMLIAAEQEIEVR